LTEGGGSSQGVKRTPVNLYGWEEGTGRAKILEWRVSAFLRAENRFGVPWEFEGQRDVQ